MPYGSMLHIPPTNLLLPAAKQEPYKKNKKTHHLSLDGKKRKNNFLEKVQKNGPAGRKKMR